MATSKMMPSTRDWASACEETSIDTAWVLWSAIPRSRSCANNACSSGDSGVVLVPVSVPITIVGMPACSSTDPSRCDTVVLPLVPVTPAVSSWRDGCPKNAEATRPIDGRADPGATLTWMTWVSLPTSTACSQSRPSAPRATASAAWS